MAPSPLHPAAPPAVVEVESWGGFEELARALDGWAFRGQRDARWSLTTSLARYLGRYVPERDQWPQREARAIRIFRRKAHNDLQDRSILEDDLRCLALMQHHGAPTRLFDFTKSPYVAAFFALESAVGDAAVVALNTPLLWKATPRGRPDLTRERVDPRRPGGLARHFLGNDHEVVWVGEPREMDRRLIAQSGTFVLPGVLHEPLEALLSRYEDGERLLTRIVLPAALRTEAMRALYRMNVTYASLFPDIEGLARSTAYELEVVWEALSREPVSEQDLVGEGPAAAADAAPASGA